MGRIFFLSIVVLIIAIIASIYFIKNNEPKFSHSFIKIGSILPVSTGELQKISQQEFYILLLDTNLSFPPKYLSNFPNIIKKIGGLMERADSNSLLFAEIFGLHRDKNKKIFSIILITDKNATIVGIYPNKKLHELVDVLQLHPHLIDLNLVETAL